jgi:hypothetical protein
MHDPVRVINDPPSSLAVFLNLIADLLSSFLLRRDKTFPPTGNASLVSCSNSCISGPWKALEALELKLLYLQVKKAMPSPKGEGYGCGC